MFDPSPSSPSPTAALPDGALPAASAESLLALTADLAAVAVWRYDLQAQHLQANDQAFKVFGIAPRPQGLSLDELRGLVHPDDLHRVFAVAELALASSGTTDMELRCRRGDDAWRHVLTRRVVQRDAQGRAVAFLGVALDLTERIEAQRRADESARRFELVTRAAGVGYWTFDPGAERATWGPPLRTLYGLVDGEPVPTWREWLARGVHPDDRARVQERFVQWRTGGGESLDLSFRALRHDGSVRQVATHTRTDGSAGKPLLYGVVIDVSERQDTERALRGARERAELAARGAGIGTWEQELHQDVAHWDEQMWRLRGHPPRPGAMTHAERQACVHPDDRARAQAELGEATASGAPLDYEFRVVWPDGQVRWLASRSAEIVDEASGMRRRIGVNWDVTDRRIAEDAQRDRESALHESQAKSQFLARMSHELRTPLNAVLGFAQLLLAEEAGDSAPSQRRRQRLEHVRAAGQHLLALIDDVLDLARVEGGELRIALQPVTLDAIVADALQQVLPQAQARHIEVRTTASGLHVLADPVRLRQVLHNLLSNAVKYNRDGGRVNVDARVEGSGVALRVADTGRGLSAQQITDLFEPFNRLGADRDTVDGTGIGLAIVKALVQTMGGQVLVTSEVGVGSVFTVQLAAAPANATARAPARSPASTPASATAAGGDTDSGPPSTRRVADDLPHAPPVDARARPGDDEPLRPRLLYIEDNPVNALIIRELVGRRDDIALVVAVDGCSGVAQARALRPALVLLDMQLPDIDGFEVLRRLRADPDTAGIPVVALSANAMPDHIQRTLEAGVSDYWTKPLDLQQVTVRLDRWFGPGGGAGDHPRRGP
jgi:PAS domain S-box-containing protein